MVEINLEALTDKEQEVLGKQKRPGRKTKDKEPEGPPPLDWKGMAPIFCMPFNLVLEGLKAEKMTKDQEVQFTHAWGSVIDKWTPDMAGYREEFAALYITVTLFGPPIYARYIGGEPPVVDLSEYWTCGQCQNLNILKDAVCQFCNVLRPMP